MRGLHQQSSPGWPNQSLPLTPLCFTSFLFSHSPSLSSTYLPFPSCPALSHFRLSQVRSEGPIKINLQWQNRQMTSVSLTATSTAMCWCGLKQIFRPWCVGRQPQGPFTTPLIPYFHFLSDCVCLCLCLSAHMLNHTGYLCVNDYVRVNIKAAAKHRLYLKRRV